MTRCPGLPPIDPRAARPAPLPRRTEMADACTAMRPLPRDELALLAPSLAEITVPCTPVAALPRTQLPKSHTALAFWRRNTRVLVAFNSSFAALLKMPPSRLASQGARWESFLLPADAAALHSELAAGLRVTQSRRLQLRVISMDGSVAACAVTITLILTNGDEEELLWAIVPDPSVACPAVAPPLLSALATDAALNRDRRYSHGSSFSGSEEEEADSAEVEPVGAALRELVPAPTRGRNPWDANVIKFSLKRRSPPADHTVRKRLNSPEPLPI